MKWERLKERENEREKMEQRESVREREGGMFDKFSRWLETSRVCSVSSRRLQPPVLMADGSLSYLLPF